MKTLIDMTFSELAEDAVLKIDSALLKGGGTGMFDEVFTQLAKAIQWRDEKEAKSVEEYEKFEPYRVSQRHSKHKAPTSKVIFWSVLHIGVIGVN